MQVVSGVLVSVVGLSLLFVYLIDLFLHLHFSFFKGVEGLDYFLFYLLSMFTLMCVCVWVCMCVHVFGWCACVCERAMHCVCACACKCAMHVCVVYMCVSVLYMCVCVYIWVLSHRCEGQRTTFGSQYSPATMGSNSGCEIPTVGSFTHCVLSQPTPPTFLRQVLMYPRLPFNLLPPPPKHHYHRYIQPWSTGDWTQGATQAQQALL